MAKESSSFFSCFSENTQPPVDSCESAPVLADASANAIPNACPEVQSSSYDNAAANSNVSPAAAAEEADGRRHDPKIVPSASAPPFQAAASHDASSAAAAEGFSASAVPTQDAPSSGGSSSSFPTESDVIKIMHKAAAVDEENGNVNLEDLIQHISELLELIKNDIIPTAPNLLKGIGQAHWVTAGLLVVSNILERFELAKYVQELKERPRLKEGMKDLIQEALEMIVKASIMCCVQINSPKFSTFFSASVDKEGLVKLQQELENKYKHMNNRFDICLYYATDCRTVRPPIPLEREYPKSAVGIEEQLKEAINLLDWKSEKNAVAVIVYGFGVGKSTLADAVFARLHIEGSKYSMVRLFDDITSTPNIQALQKWISTDLTMGIAEGKTDFRTFESGQREIRRILEKEVADNVLDCDRLHMLMAKKSEGAYHCPGKRCAYCVYGVQNGNQSVCYERPSHA